jgi:hypothetical protein
MKPFTESRPGRLILRLVRKNRQTIARTEIAEDMDLIEVEPQHQKAPEERDRKSLPHALSQQMASQAKARAVVKHLPSWPKRFWPRTSALSAMAVIPRWRDANGML